MLIQIVPALPPTISGVGDYAVSLSRVLLKAHGVESSFVVCDPLWKGPVEIDGFPITRLDERSASALQDALTSLAGNRSAFPPSKTQAVLLQLSPYGFERNGAPFWLARGICEWRQARGNSSPPLVTLFHELYAMSPPWQRAFWVTIFQRKAIKQIYESTDVVLTTLARYSKYLDRYAYSTERHARTLNTASSVGEPSDLPPLLTRPASIAVFGSARSRAYIYEKAASEIRDLINMLGVHEIVDIGAPLVDAAIPSLPCRFRALGVLPATAVSRELLQSRAGLVTYPVTHLGKSGIYAAYCAHGLAPIVCLKGANREASEDGFSHGRHFLDISEVALRSDWPSLAYVAAQAHLKYADRSLSCHADVLSRHVLT